MKRRFKPDERYFVVDMREGHFAIYDNARKRYLEIDGKTTYTSLKEAQLALEAIEGLEAD